MASIYLKKDRRIFYAQWSVYDSATGRWVVRQKSTGESDARAAQEKADEFQRNADAVAALAGARRRTAPATVGRDMPRMSAREREILEAAMLEDPARDPRRKAGLWVEFLEDTLARVENEDTRAKYRACAERWARWCGEQGRPLRYLEDADVALAEGWRDALVADGLRAKRVNFCLTAVGMVYRRAWKRALIVASPFEDVQRVAPVPTQDDLPSDPFTDEEVERLTLAPYKVAAGVRHHADGWRAGMAKEWEIVIRLAAVTGQRLVDALTIRRDMLDLEAGILDYLPSKTAKKGCRIAFPLRYWPDTVTILKRWKLESRQNVPETWVTPLLVEMTKRSSVWASRAFVRILDAAGIEREVAREGKGKGRTRHRKGFHSFRHTANTRAAARGVPAEIRRELFGHSTVEMNRIYTHWDASVLDELMRKNVSR